MSKLALFLTAVAMVFFLGACERQEQTQTPGQPGQQEQPAQPEQERAQPPATEQQRPGQSEEAPAGTTGQTSSMQEPSAQAPSEEQAATAQPGAAERSADESSEAASQEFLGQSPEFGNAPETIVLQAKNGNVTLSHKEHAQRMDCSTCHGEGAPGKIEGFSKDPAHKLCQGCHKEQGAGPTKCQECHIKS
ncbi:MAG: hypothetical protein WDA20_09220 [Desulfuromonadales bacterium]